MNTVIRLSRYPGAVHLHVDDLLILASVAQEYASEVRELYPKPVDRGLGEERGVPSWLSKTSGG